jgi:hypothetical protein
MVRGEAVVFPFVYETGAAKLRDCRDRGLNDEQTAIAVYLVMEELMHVTYLSAPETIQ